MSISSSPPPLTQPIVDETGTMPLLWMLFFNNLFQGDAGEVWIPTFQGLTVAGTAPTVTGRVYQISKYLAYFSVKVVPGTSTSAVAGTTYINNFPLTAQSDGVCCAVSGRLGEVTGMVEAATNNIWVPAWSAVTVPLTIIGIVEAK